MSTASNVAKLYRTVVEDVVNNVKEAFLDEGVDEQVLQELKQLWENKLAASKALEPAPTEELGLSTPVNTVVLPHLQTSSQSTQQAIAPQRSEVQQVAQLQARAAPGPGAPSLAIPQGLFQQQLRALGAGGQMQNITLQQAGNTQYITVAGLSGGGLQQFQQLQQQALAPQVAQQMHQAQQVRLQPQPQQTQQQKLLQQGTITLQPTQPGEGHKGQMVPQGIIQVDGNGDTSSSEDEDFDDDDKDDDENEEENQEENQGEEEEPLNSDDDVKSEEDPTELFATDNVVVCQFDRVNRNKNKWKFCFKDGIMNLNGRDFVFQKATGDSEW